MNNSLKSLNEFFEDFTSDGVKNQKELIQTGFPLFDLKLGGGLRSGLTVLGAIPSLGKSTLMLQIAENVSARGIPVLYFSLEMFGVHITAKAISRNFFCNENAIDLDKGKMPSSSEIHKDRGISAQQILLTKSFEDLKKTYWETRGEEIPDFEKQFRKSLKNAKRRSQNLHINEGVLTDTDANGNTVQLTTGRIAEIVKHFIAANSFENQERQKPAPGPLVIVDYLQILVPDDSQNKGIERQEIDKSVRILSNLSRSADIPVVVISSLSRGSYEKKVGLDSFKESGGIEYSADTIIGLSFEAQGQGVRQAGFDRNVENARNPREVELTILKQRYGESGLSTTVHLDYYSKFDFFCENREKNQTKKNGEPKAPKTQDGLSSTREADYERREIYRSKTIEDLKNHFPGRIV